jgi:hypothetical protein
MEEGTTAYRFRRWVTEEVLPSLRKTGGDETPSVAPRLQGTVGRHLSAAYINAKVQAAKFYLAWNPLVRPGWQVVCWITVDGDNWGPDASSRPTMSSPSGWMNFRVSQRTTTHQ